MPNAILPPGRKRLMCDVPERLHRIVKTEAAQTGLSLNALLQQVLEKTFAERKPAKTRPAEKVA